MIMREFYSTDITDSQWQLVEPHLPKAKTGGRKRKTSLREILNAIFYMLRTGCAWRLLPHDFPKWRTVYGYFQQWHEDGTWKKLNRIFREKVRLKAGRNTHPSAGCLDSQSLKKAGTGQETGYDGGKKVNGRKRTILVDTMGLLLDVVVHSAHRSDHQGLILLGTWFAPLWQCLQVIWTDSTFGGKDFIDWVEHTFGWTLNVVSKKQGQKGFEVLPRRWVVERTFAWFGRYRRLSKDYEYLPTTSETMLYVAMVHLMLQRLA
ncbi:IS5 family transposase (plasmid) [Synechocystis sp. B12]|nr:IS5 family transposase [Synechocystis sp. B12]WLT37578.1 IS5 family transposase [Synechocystis sp. B12]WLT37717.1 IS5 family transposase [Synechocystis sp. B12]WLT37981.1 IS5 family transposase [Synechocystis sp. B12]WLT38290.1 IS5 family transposase [Synechocystis sp. B12]